jgi:hypothetical protein
LRERSFEVGKGLIAIFAQEHTLQWRKRDKYAVNVLQTQRTLDFGKDGLVRRDPAQTSKRQTLAMQFWALSLIDLTISRLAQSCRNQCQFLLWLP